MLHGNLPPVNAERSSVHFRYMCKYGRNFMKDCFPSCSSHCRSIARPERARCCRMHSKSWHSPGGIPDVAGGVRCVRGKTCRSSAWLRATLRLRAPGCQRRAAWMLSGGSGRPFYIVLPESDWTAGFTAGSRSGLAADGLVVFRCAAVRSGGTHACGTLVRQKKQGWVAGCGCHFGRHPARSLWRSAPLFAARGVTGCTQVRDPPKLTAFVEETRAHVVESRRDIPPSKWLGFTTLFARVAGEKM